MSLFKKCVTVFTSQRVRRLAGWSVDWKRARSVKTVTAEGTAAISMWFLISFCVVPAGPDPVGCVYTDFLWERKEGLGKARAEKHHHYLEIHPPSIHLLWDGGNTTYSCRHMFTQRAHTHTHTVSEGGLQLKDDSFKSRFIMLKRPTTWNSIHTSLWKPPIKISKVLTVLWKILGWKWLILFMMNEFDRSMYMMSFCTHWLC